MNNIVIEYFLDWDTVRKDTERFQLESMTKQALYDAFATGRVLIIDRKALEKTLFFEAELVGFASTFFGGLKVLKKGIAPAATCASMEQSYNFTLHIEGQKLVIDSANDEKRVEYDFQKFYTLFKDFYRKFHAELLHYYPALQHNPEYQRTAAVLREKD